MEYEGCNRNMNLYISELECTGAESPSGRYVEALPDVLCKVGSGWSH